MFKSKFDLFLTSSGCTERVADGERALLDWTTKYRSAWNEKRHRQSMKPGWFVIDPDIARGPAVASLARKRPLWASTDQHFSI
jgi:hypothetical protein